MFLLPLNVDWHCHSYYALKAAKQQPMRLLPRNVFGRLDRDIEYPSQHAIAGSDLDPEAVFTRTRESVRKGDFVGRVGRRASRNRQEIGVGPVRDEVTRL